MDNKLIMGTCRSLLSIPNEKIIDGFSLSQIASIYVNGCTTNQNQIGLKSPNLKPNQNRTNQNMNLKTIFSKIVEDSRAVSPVVATLVLVVVAIVGAAAVGAMTGQFTDEVGEEEVGAEAAGRTLMIGGSTTVEPVARELARAFMGANPGIRVIVQGGGSGAGVAAAARDVIDIGMASRDPRPGDMPEGVTIPQLRTVKIGESEIVVIVGEDVTLANMNILKNITTDDLARAFRDNNFTGNLSDAGIERAIQRSDVSGTEDVFMKVIGLRGVTPNATIEGLPGNAPIRADVLGRTDTISFVDYGFKIPDSTITDEDIEDLTDTCLDRPLNFITLGYPGTLEEAFIDFVRQPGQHAIFDRVGVKHL